MASIFCQKYRPVTVTAYGCGTIWELFWVLQAGTKQLNHSIQRQLKQFPQQHLPLSCNRFMLSFRPHLVSNSSQVRQFIHPKSKAIQLDNTLIEGRDAAATRRLTRHVQKIKPCAYANRPQEL
ncbi:hypothetical protein VTI28DRAFT_3278 [Corynascus sepedonium]